MGDSLPIGQYIVELQRIEGECAVMRVTKLDQRGNGDIYMRWMLPGDKLHYTCTLQMAEGVTKELTERLFDL